MAFSSSARAATASSRFKSAHSSRVALASLMACRRSPLYDVLTTLKLTPPCHEIFSQLAVSVLSKSPFTISSLSLPTSFNVTSSKKMLPPYCPNTKSSSLSGKRAEKFHVKVFHDVVKSYDASYCTSLLPPHWLVLEEAVSIGHRARVPLPDPLIRALSSYFLPTVNGASSL